MPSHLGWLWRGWMELRSCRNEMGVIPWTAVDAWARRRRLDDDDFQALLYVCMQLDDTVAEYHRERSAK